MREGPIWLIACCLAALAGYELFALWSPDYLTITQYVDRTPFEWMVVIAAGCLVLGVHFWRSWFRRQRRQRRQ